MNGRDYIFPAAVLKGVVEHGDGTAYFGSLMGYRDHLDHAVRLGWVETTSGHVFPTHKGREVYEVAGLAKFPKIKFSRAYSWDWSRTHFDVSAL